MTTQDQDQDNDQSASPPTISGDAVSAHIVLLAAPVFLANLAQTGEQLLSRCNCH